MMQSGGTAIMLAAKDGRVETVNVLLERGACVEKQDSVRCLSNCCFIFLCFFCVITGSHSRCSFGQYCTDAMLGVTYSLNFCSQSSLCLNGFRCGNLTEASVMDAIDVAQDETHINATLDLSLG